MPTDGAKSGRRCVPSSVLEGLLLQAPDKPEALYQVVGWVWSSLVYNTTRDDTTQEAHLGGTPPSPSSAAVKARGDSATQPLKLAPATATLSTGASWEPPTLSQHPSLSPKVDTPLREALSVHGEPITPYLEHTLAGRATSSGIVIFSDGEETGGNPSAANYLDTTLTAATGTGHSILTALTASSSVGDTPLITSAQTPPLAQLSPLILRVLLWWAGRPTLPPLRSDTPAAQRRGPYDAWAPSRGSTNGSDDSSGNTTTSTTADFVPAQQRRQREAEEPHQLRLRIAEIFVLLCRRGFGIVVSDALVYGRCHDASEAMAARCHFTFNRYAPAAWGMATAAATAAATAKRAGEVRSRDPATMRLPDVVRPAAVEEANSGGAASDLYHLEGLLAAVLDVHATRPILSVSSGNGGAPAAALSSDADVTATGQLLRCLLHCPRLHSRITRLLDVSESTAKKRKGAATSPVFGNAPSTTLLSSPSMSASPLGTSRHTLPTDAAGRSEENAEASPIGSLRLQAFLPALTHPSPVVSSEAWQTLWELLFPTSNMSGATRRLLQRTPECPVQHLLVGALAMSTDNDLSSPLCAVALHGSHAMVRNSALRLLHVLCVSKDVPPAAQRLFIQCPALLWRVVRLAAELCQGNPVASAVLVRQALADYVMTAVERLIEAADGGVSALTPVQRLLHNNRVALAAFFTATHALCRQRGGAVPLLDDNGGNSAEAATSVVYDEAGLQRALCMLEVADAA